MTQKERKPRPDEEKPPGEESSPSDSPPKDPEVRGTMEAGRKALQESAEEIERAKRLLRETEELGDLPGASQPSQGGETEGTT